MQVADACRQDVLALQVISLLKDIFQAVGLDLCLYPYGVLLTNPERGIIKVVPNTRSRSQMGETTDGGLYEIFQQDFGAVGSPSFEVARHNFIISSASYTVASLLLQPKDRHNGNLLVDKYGQNLNDLEMRWLPLQTFFLKNLSHYDRFVSRIPQATEAHGCQGYGEKQKSESI